MSDQSGTSRTSWAVDCPYGALEPNLCQICKEIQRQSQEELPDPERVITHSGSLDATATQGCPVCQILRVAIQAYAANLRTYESDDGNRLRLQDFDLGHKIVIKPRIGSRNLKFMIEVKDAKNTFESTRRAVNNNIEVFASSATTEVSSFFGLGRDVPQALEHRKCCEFLNAQLAACNDSHLACKQQSFFSLPRRVLKISNNAVRLVDTEATNYEGQYVTLSYCWGPPEALIQTTKATLAARSKSISWSELPQLFKDAIFITRELGIDFIWIDCLCIVQDDRYEWGNEAPKMSDYYSNSYLTISATRCGSPAESLFSDRVSSTTRVYQSWMSYEHKPQMLNSNAITITVYHGMETTSLQVRPLFKDARRMFRDLLYKQAGVVVPLMDRAWVFQERMLARRTLHFHAREMVYECQVMLTCECDTLDTELEDLRQTVGLCSRLPRLDFQVNEDVLESVMCFWLDVVNEYARKSITHESDRLLALAGLASRFATQFGGVYLAGLWKGDLPRQLLWQPSHKTGSQVDGPKRQEGLPTWSWATIPALGANYDGLQGELFWEVNRRVQVLDAQTRHLNNSPFGNVASGYIQLEAEVIEVILGLRKVVIGLSEHKISYLEPFLKIEPEGEEVTAEHSTDETKVEELTSPHHPDSDEDDDMWDLYSKHKVTISSDGTPWPGDGPDIQLFLDLALMTVKDQLHYDSEPVGNKKIYCILLGHGSSSRTKSKRNVDRALVVSSSDMLDEGPCKRMGVARISWAKGGRRNAKVSTLTIQ